MFGTYFMLGLDHIVNLKGYDHIIFLLILCAAYRIADWKKLLILVTAFTIGHTVTLALATLKVLDVNTKLIEILIPVTIFITALMNLIQNRHKTFMWPKYLAAMFFGLIHGLGFSNYLRMLLSKSSNIVLPLFGFNIGVEAGQILIVIAILIFGFLVVSLKGVSRRDWTYLLSGAGIGTSLIMIIDRI